MFVDTAYGLDQIGELVSELKDFARLDRAFSEEVDLNDCVRNAVLIARTAIKDKAEIQRPAPASCQHRLRAVADQPGAAEPP